MKFKLTISILLLGFSTFLFGQNECTIEVCNNDECGSVFVTYKASGQNVFVKEVK
ncbi:MAG: hypothetical protein R2879_09265 [Saprospiraceae bacterium]